MASSVMLMTLSCLTLRLIVRVSSVEIFFFADRSRRASTARLTGACRVRAASPCRMIAKTASEACEEVYDEAHVIRLI